MKILVGNKELEVLNCYAYRHTNGKLELNIKVLQSLITHDDFKKLLKENTDDVVCVNDDGRTQTFSGFHYSLKLTDTSENNGDGTFRDIYEATMECVSEAEFQNGILKQQIAELNKSVQNQNEVINAQNEVINNQASNIALMEEVMLEQLMA